ncbi:unnamed protein product, partial [Laminaria digitata]
MANEMRDIGLTVEDPMLYTCFINALPYDEHEFEIRELKGRLHHNRDEILRLVRSQHELLRRVKSGRNK